MSDPRPLVLIADDDMEIRALVRRALGDLNIDLIEAHDGEDALEKIIVEAPDLVVLDVMMPTLTGWEICKYIRSKPHLASTRVVMLTAVGKTVNELTSPLYGADAYLDKPFDLKELAAEVKRLLIEAAEADALEDE